MSTSALTDLEPWRKLMDAMTDDSGRWQIFSSASEQFASLIGRGIERSDAVDRLQSLAEQYELETDHAQMLMADAFRNVEEPRPGDYLQSLADDASSLLDDEVVAPRILNGRDVEQVMVPVQTSGAIVRQLHAPEYLVDTVLQRRFLYSLTGKTGSGKTAIALYITACVALGRPIGDFQVEQGNALYLAGENPDDVAYRWLAMSQQMDFNHDTIPVSFVMQRFTLSRGFVSLADQASMIGGLSLVVVDTSPAFFEGDQVNDNVQQGTHARMLRNLVNLPGGPCVLALCHPVKNAAPDNLIPLGAGSFLNEVDGNLTAAVEGSAVQVHWQGKIRGADFDPINFELASVGHERLISNFGPFKTIVAKHISDAAREGIDKVVKGDADLVLAEIQAHPTGSRREYASRLGWLLAGGQPHYSKASRAINKLLAAKLVAKDLDGFAVTDKGAKRLQKRLDQSGSTALQQSD